MDIKPEIKEGFGEKAEAVGFAPPDRFGGVPENHHASSEGGRL